MTEEHRQEQSPAQKPYHEEGDVNPGAVALTGAGLLVALVITGLIVAGTRACYSGEHPNEKLSSKFEQVAERRKAEPGVELDPSRVLERIRAQNMARLTNYMWIEGEERRAQIPIDRAIELEPAEPEANDRQKPPEKLEPGETPAVDEPDEEPSP